MTTVHNVMTTVHNVITAVLANKRLELSSIKFNHLIPCSILHLLRLWLVFRSTLKLLDTIQNLCYLIKLWQQILIMSSLKTFLVFIVWTIITGILMATCSCGISTLDWSILTISWGKYHVTISILYVVPSYQSDYFFLQCLWTQQDLY